MILDVGCGSHPKGDVNLDMSHGRTPHHPAYIDGRRIPSFILGDGQRLPIRDKAFDTLYCSHTIEHMPEPSKALREFSRVANRVIILVPNNRLTWEAPEHLYSWTPTSLRNLLRRHFSDVRVYTYTRLGDAGWLLRLFGGRRLLKKLWCRVLGALVGFELVAVCMNRGGCWGCFYDGAGCTEDPGTCKRPGDFRPTRWSG